MIESNLTESAASLFCALDVLGNLVDLSTGGGGLLSPGLALVGGLAGLDLLEGGIALGGADLGLLGGTLADVVEGDTDDGTGDLVGAAAILLDGDIGGALLVQAAPCLGPYELGGLLPLHGQAEGLGGAEEEGLAITTDEELAVTGVDPVLGQSTKFSCIERNTMGKYRREKFKVSIHVQPLQYRLSMGNISTRNVRAPPKKTNCHAMCQLDASARSSVHNRRESTSKWRHISKFVELFFLPSCNPLTAPPAMQDNGRHPPERREQNGAGLSSSPRPKPLHFRPPTLVRADAQTPTTHTLYHP